MHRSRVKLLDRNSIVLMFDFSSFSLYFNILKSLINDKKVYDNLVDIRRKVEGDKIIYPIVNEREYTSLVFNEILEKKIVSFIGKSIVIIPRSIKRAMDNKSVRYFLDCRSSEIVNTFRNSIGLPFIDHEINLCFYPESAIDFSQNIKTIKSL